jgi:ribonuclease VapC
MVVESRAGAHAAAALDRWLESAPIEVVVVTRHHMTIARKGFRRFGKGRHPAGLNFGDCFSYALAGASREPLLFKGNNFYKTDLAVASVPNVH